MTARARGRRPIAAPALALAATVAALLSGGCGNNDAPAPVEGSAAPAIRMQSASCRDWRAASPHGRSTLVDRLEEIVAGPRGEGTTLPDDVAYQTLDARCGLQLARGFLLYEIYTRAAGFRSLAERVN